jgi:transcriptional regulator with XRE-family HTH domain
MGWTSIAWRHSTVSPCLTPRCLTSESPRSPNDECTKSVKHSLPWPTASSWLTHWYPIGYHRKMNIETILREARTRNSLSQRALADRSSTSHATLSAYENGRKSPTSRVVERLVRDAGFTIEPFLVTAVPRSERGQSRGDELHEVLELASQFPLQVSKTLTYPIFGTKQ